eukprot:Lankesteria_metandrocarpae@DN8113_c0_g1_i1.p1
MSSSFLQGGNPHHLQRQLRIMGRGIAHQVVKDIGVGPGAAQEIEELRFRAALECPAGSSNVAAVLLAQKQSGSLFRTAEKLATTAGRTDATAVANGNHTTSYFLPFV